MKKLHFKQDHYSQRKCHLQQVIFGAVALFWDLAALPCAYMETRRQGAKQQIPLWLDNICGISANWNARYSTKE